MSNRAILFRFHKNASLCSDRIKRLKNLNPETPVYGIGENLDGIEKMFDEGMEDLYTLEKDSRWCWKNGDLAMLEWYNNVGYKFDFDMLHLIEWDLVFTKPLDELYNGITGIGLTGKLPMLEAKRKGWNTITGQRFREYEIFKEHTNTEHQGFACIFPGSCFCRDFVEDISTLDYPELCNDEIRIGVLSAKYNYNVTDTGFFSWNDRENKKFNSKSIECEKVDVINTKDRDSFHPVYSSIP